MISKGAESHVSVPLRGLYPYKVVVFRFIAFWVVKFQSPYGDYTLISKYSKIYRNHHPERTFQSPYGDYTLIRIL